MKKYIFTETQVKALVDKMVLSEAGKTTHFDERFLERMYFDEYEVVFSGDHNGKHVLEIVGKYKLSQEDRNEIKRKIDVLSKMEFPDDKAYGFILHHFDINGPDDIIIDNPNDRYWVRKVMKTSERPLFFILDPTRPYNDYNLAEVLMVVIKNNKLTTVMFNALKRLTPNRHNFDYLGDDIDDLVRELSGQSTLQHGLGS